MEDIIQQRARPSRIQEATRAKTTKVTNHPWLTPSTPQAEFSFPLAESKSTSYTSISNTSCSTGSKYDWRMHSLTLCRHILTRGLVDGIGSDIQIYVPNWHKTYHLHRLVLDQNPYFKLLLQGGFRESETNQISLNFEKEDTFINKESFQFVLEYLYGKIEDPCIQQSNVRQILATCSYFQLDVICGLCVDFIMKNLNQRNVVDYLLFSNEYMVQGSDRISDAVCSFLCREAYNMDCALLVALPLEWLQKVIESDAFWVPSEFERYQFIKQVIYARHQSYLADKDNFLLTELDTNPNCHLISKAIYYMHMTFEQLESIQGDIHPFTKERLVPERVLKDALWLQVRLRSKIESALERDTKLNMTVSKEEEDEQQQKEDDEPIVERQYYPIPTNDTTTYTGESAISLTSLSPHQQSKKKVSENAEQYSIYPPFRFGVEFADVATLKHGMRVYSDTVFYAGSNWNMYIQKTRSQRKGILQLGVYLHRQSVPQNYTTCQHPDTEYTNRPENNNANEPWSFSRYADKRKVVKTWFKIYCPSRGPKHALTLFQSSPDNFSILQSWGWRSTTLCADEEANASSQLSEMSPIDPNEVSNKPLAPSSSTPPLSYTPQTSNQLQYLQSMYDLKTLKSALSNNSQQSLKLNIPSGPTLRFTVVMGHV